METLSIQCTMATINSKQLGNITGFLVVDEENGAIELTKILHFDWSTQEPIK